MQILSGLEAKRYKRLRRITANAGVYIITIMWVIGEKCGGLLSNTVVLSCLGEPVSIVTASSILDVGRRPGSVSDICCINY